MAGDSFKLIAGDTGLIMKVTGTGTAQQFPDIAAGIGCMLRCPVSNGESMLISFDPAMAAASCGDLAPGQVVSIDISNPRSMYYKRAGSGSPVMEIWVLRQGQ